MANCFCLKWRPDVVRALDFRHCNLFFVPDEVYEFGETLEELYLDSNDIRDLPRPLFHCQLLKKLGASDNELFTVPPAIGSLINLKELDLSKNGIVSLPDGIKGCRALELMEISVNPLGCLPEGFTELVSLTQLYLNDTLLNYLPANIGQLVKLKVLEVRENRLKALPRSMGKMTELERLDLGQNAFRELPDVVGSLGSLQELWIDNNMVTHIPRSIGGLSKLFYFDACRNQIEELPETISGWERIKDIHLSKNFIQRLPERIDPGVAGDRLGWERIKDIHLSKNFIQRRPERICQLSSLSTLRVDNNQISCLPYSIGGLVSLEELILNANDLEELPPSVGILRRLRHLNIDDNMLMSLPPELGSCGKISLLSLRGNHLETLPDEISRISSLTVANLSNNRLKYLPFNFTKLKNLQALWLSENQAKPLIPLQTEMDEATGRRVLTCYLLPQQPLDDVEYGDDDDSESFHMSVWSQQRRERMTIAFDVSESEPESSPVKKHAYPKESFKPRFRGGPYSHLSNGGVPSRNNENRLSQERILGRRELADEGSVSGSVRSSRPRSPDPSVISDTHALFKADKERRARDKERLRRSSAKDTKDDLQVQWELPRTTPVSLKGRKRRGSGKIIIKDRNVHSDTEAMDSHPMKVRSPRSAWKRSSGREGDNVDPEVAQLTDSFRRAFTTEKKNQTDTELFTKNDMPDVVFQPKPTKHSLVTPSASMNSDTRRFSGQGMRDGRRGVGIVERRAIDRSSPASGHTGLTNRLTPDGHSTDGTQSDASACSAAMAHRTPQTQVGRPIVSQRDIRSVDPQRESSSVAKRHSSGLSDSLVRSGISQLESHPYIATPSLSYQEPDSTIKNGTLPVSHRNLGTSGVGNQQSASLAQGRSSGMSDSLVKSGMSRLESQSYCGTPSLSYHGEQNSAIGNRSLPVPPVRNSSVGGVNIPRSASLAKKEHQSGRGDSSVGVHNNSSQHQGRDSGISGVSVQSGPPVTDPEIDRLYAMRYQRVPPSPYHGGYDPEESVNPQPEHVTGGTQGYGGGYSVGQQRGGMDRGQNGYRGGATLYRGSEEFGENKQERPPGGERSRADKTPDPQGLERSQTVTPGGNSNSRWRDDRSSSGQQWGYNVEVETAKRLSAKPSGAAVDHQWARGNSPAFTPSTEGRNTQSLVHMSRSHPRTGGDSLGQPQASPPHSPWDPTESPSLPGTEEMRTDVPASGDYSAQLREASGRLLSHKKEPRPYTGTPAQFYEEPPSVIEKSGLKGARRHLRFSSENQTIVDGASRLSEQLQNLVPGDGVSGDDPPVGGDSTLHGSHQGMVVGPSYAASNHRPQSRTSHRQSDQLGGSNYLGESCPYNGTPSLSYQNQPSTVEDTSGTGLGRHSRFSSENQTIFGDRTAGLLQQSQIQPKNNNLGDTRSAGDVLPNRTSFSMNSCGTVAFGESTFNEPNKSLSLQGRANSTAHTTSNLGGSHSNTPRTGPKRPSREQRFQERPVDVPPEIIAAEEKERIRLSQIPTPSFQQFRDITPMNSSTPHPNGHTSSMSSGRPFSSPGHSRSLPARGEEHDRESTGLTGNGQSVVSERDGRDSGIMWAVPSWVSGDDDDGNYVTDVNSNVSKDAAGRRGREQRDSRVVRTERQSGGESTHGRNFGASQRAVSQHDVLPESTMRAQWDQPSRRGDNINKHHWKNHLVGHSQKRRELPLTQQMGVTDRRSQTLQNTSQVNMGKDNSGGHHRPSTPSQPLYHQALRNSNMMPPSITRKVLPGVPPETGDEDTRRVTPPGSSGSSTIDSFPKTAPASHNTGGTPYGYQRRKDPRMYGTAPPPQRTTLAQKRSAPTQQMILPGRDESQWF